MKVTIAARVDENVDSGLEQIAARMGRSKSALVSEALRSYVESEQHFIQAVEAGREDLKQGRTVDHATVAAALERALRS